MKHRWRDRAIVALIVAAAVALTVRMAHEKGFEPIHHKARDLNFLFRGPVPARNVMLVVMDQASLDTFPEPMMFWHPYYADVIRGAAAGGAKVLGLDVTFLIPVDQWNPGKEYDQKLAAAVIETAGTMPVITASVPSTLAKQEQWAVQLNMFSATMGRAGVPTLRADTDDFIRTLEVMEEPDPAKSGPAWKNLSARVAEVYAGQEITYQDGKLHWKGGVIPVVAPRAFQINYAGPAGTFPRVPLHEVVAAFRGKDEEKLKSWFAGKIVLVGVDTIDDRHATPYYTLSPGLRANTAGVEIHANAISTLVEGRYLRLMPAWAVWTVLTAIGVLCALCGRHLTGNLLGIAGGGVFALTLVIPQVLFLKGWLMAASELLMTAALSVLGVFLFRSLSAEQTGALFKQAVSVFVGEKLTTELMTTGAIQRTGKRQQVTILFTDIRGFTAWCESKDPATVVEKLNHYFSTMVPHIVAEGGMVDKFIGDGIMAIFSAEDKHADNHAVRAARAALNMVREPLGEFKTGAGINSGEVVLGSIGSADKMDFTALGDTVNLASRLESLNKEHKTRMLISESANELLNGAIETVCVAEVQVRGKAVPVKIFTAKELVP
ncbi:MAG: adenylate/guanylate cyclase domain-containing protein [Acidobacteria bacterium]|nr:adenylate/guanylate cyclase domain-containing protein [Acidobacteriota bacterium]